MIQRYFDPQTFSAIKQDFKFLPAVLEKYFGEIEFSIRDNYFNLYFKGNSLSKVKYLGNNTYEVSINKKFFEKSRLNKDPRFTFIDKKDYQVCKVGSKLLHPLFQKSNIDSLCSQIRDVNNGEEIGFEQAIITDNLNNPVFFIIDRQITDSELKRKRIDLLALKQIQDDNYKFVVIEVKLGKNSELEYDVYNQLYQYVNHIKAHILEYRDCYEVYYRQKKELGLISLPYNSISIDDQDVEGRVVVGGYSNLADKYIACLKAKSNINIVQFRYELK